MTPLSDDEFDDLYDYDESLEVEIQRLETEMGNKPTVEPVKESITIAYEPSQFLSPAVVKDEVDPSEVALSQSSAFEEELVDQVTTLLHPAVNDIEEINQTSTDPDVKIIPLSVDENGNMLEAVQIIKDDRSLFQRFRKREFFSVSDLVGPLWCEVQYDYRLRSKPYLKPEDRPAIIVTREGKHIPLNKIKAGDHDKIMKRGEIVHKKLEKEIHPIEVRVTTTTREDVWGLRFLNMLSSLQALLDIGKCRELPVVGFVRGYMVVGVIDELVLEKIETPEDTQSDSPERKSQRLLTSFFASNPQSKSRRTNKRTHRLLVSDSKTRASGTLPRLDTAKSGMTQLMCYKEILDGMLLASNERHPSGKSHRGLATSEQGDTATGSQACPITIDEDSGTVFEPAASETSQQSSALAPSELKDLGISKGQPFEDFTWDLLFSHLHLDPNATLSEGFLVESRSVIHGNGLASRLYDSLCLWDYVDCWVDLVERLGLGQVGPGAANNSGRTEDRLELVYRNVRTTSTKVDRKRRSRRVKGLDHDAQASVLSEEPMPMFRSSMDQIQRTEEKRLLDLAIKESLRDLSEPTSVNAGLAEMRSLEETLSPPSSSKENGKAVLLQTQTSAISQSETSQTSLNVDDSKPLELRQETVPSAETGQASVTDHDRDSQTVAELCSSISSKVDKKSKRKRPKDGSIIGSHVFTHDRVSLAHSLESVLNFWMGTRQPAGVGIENVNRCGWCEFEEGCEWRDEKAKEAAAKNRASMKRA